MSDDAPRPKAFDQNYERYKKSKREEDRIADKLGGRRIPRSGGLSWSSSDKTTDGGDLKGRHMLVEHKRVEPHVKSIGVKREWLAKLTKGSARRADKVPGLVISFEKPQGHAQDWLMIPLDIAKRLMAVQLEDDDGEG